MKRTATAHWTGDVQNGQGNLTTMSGTLSDTPYSFKARFQNDDGKAGTNPEELIAAAHAGCFTMALSAALTKAGFTADSLHTTAEVDMRPGENGFSIEAIALNLQATIPTISAEQFQELAQDAKANCPVSKALAAVPISMTAELV